VRRWPSEKLGELRVVRVDLKRWRLASSDTRPSTPDAGLAVVEATAREAGAFVAVNGGFFDQNGEPMGLRVTDGIQRNPLRHADWGVFFVRDGVPDLVHTKDAERADGAEFAIQCGPRLVADGQPMQLRSSVHRRTVIGSDAAGKVYLVVSLGFVDMNALAAALAAPQQAGGLGLTQALNLDGGPSTQLFVDASDGVWNVAGGTGVADAIMVSARR
jgi:uncharacterized protein YigE (DUF2233 family)